MNKKQGGLSVDSVVTPDTFQAAPTIAAGDFE